MNEELSGYRSACKDIVDAGDAMADACERIQIAIEHGSITIPYILDEVMPARLEWDRVKSSMKSLWIKTEERMPEDGVDVLVKTRWGSYDIARKDWRQGGRPDHWSTDGELAYDIEDVVEWAHIPFTP